MAFTDGLAVRVKVDAANVLHATESSMSFNRDTREIVTKDTATGTDQYRSIKLGKKSAEFSVSALQSDEAGDLYATLLAAINAGTMVEVDFGTTASGDTVVTVDCYITNLEANAPAEGEFSYDLTFTTTGDFTISTNA